MRAFIGLAVALCASAVAAETGPFVTDGYEEFAEGASVVDGQNYELQAVGSPSESLDDCRVRAHGTFDFDAPCGEPDPFAAPGTPNLRALDFRMVERSLWRKFAPRTATTEGQLYVDTLLKFDVWGDDVEPAEVLCHGERFGLWAQEGADGRANLYVAALLYDDDGWETTVRTNYFRIANDIDLTRGAWHRVTVRTIEDVTRAHTRNPETYPEGIQGFMVWVDGELLRTDRGCGSFSDGYVDFLAFEPDPAWGWLDWNDPADLAVADQLQEGTVFADLTGSGGGLSGVGFGGSGSVDDLTVTTDAPRDFVSGYDYLLLDEANPAFLTASRSSVAAWLSAIGATPADAARDSLSHASYLFNLDLGLKAVPRLAITRLAEDEPGVWSLTTRAFADGKDIVLQDGIRPVVNGSLGLMSAPDLPGLEAAPVTVWPLVFEPDRRELTIRIPVSVGSFFRACIGPMRVR